MSRTVCGGGVTDAVATAGRFSHRTYIALTSGKTITDMTSVRSKARTAAKFARRGEWFQILVQLARLFVPRCVVMLDEMCLLACARCPALPARHRVTPSARQQQQICTECLSVRARQ